MKEDFSNNIFKKIFFNILGDRNTSQILFTCYTTVYIGNDVGLIVFWL